MKSLIAAAAGTLLLSGCGSSAGRPAAQSATTPAQRFIALLRTNATARPLFAADSTADLLSRGQEVCDILAHPGRQNYSYRPIDNLIHEGITAAKAAGIVWAAKRELC